MGFINYDTNKDSVRKTFWTTVDKARERLGIQKKELSSNLGKMESYYATCLFHQPEPKLSTAFKFSAAVGLTLDEAIRGESDGCFFKYLKEHDSPYERLPNTSILKSYTFKALIPTYYSAVFVCDDKKLASIVEKCLKVDDQKLFLFYYMTTGSSAPADLSKTLADLKDSKDIPNVVEQFWSGGVHFEYGKLGGLGHLSGKAMKELADKLGMGVGQLYKYMHGTGSAEEMDKPQVGAEPKLSRITHICNALQRSVDDMVEPIYSIDRWSRGYNPHDKGDLDTVFSLWYERFYNQFQKTFKALPVLDGIVRNYRHKDLMDFAEEKKTGKPIGIEKSETGKMLKLAESL